MLFNSFSYALFLPLVFVLYWLPLFRKWRGAWQNVALLLVLNWKSIPAATASSS